MRPTISQYARSLEELSGSVPASEMARIAKNFFGLLKRRGEGKKMGAILAQLEKIDALKEGRMRITVRVAHEGDKETKEKLIAQAEKLFPDKKIELAYVIDESVIGGAAFRTDEVLYDATLSNEVINFKQAILKV